MRSRPTKLYKYQPVTAQTLENMKLRRLWFSAPAAFNDPFDCSVDMVLKDLDDDDLARAWTYIKSRADLTPELEAQMATNGVPNDGLRDLIRRSATGLLVEPAVDDKFKQTGVACFSAKNDDLLMWAHYADGHRGFCMEFDTHAEPFSKAEAVAYTDTIPPVNPLDVLDGVSTGPDIIEVMLRTKFTCWQYEEEWRILHAQAGTEYTYPHELLTGVYFGMSMPSGQKDVIGQLLVGSRVQLYEMVRGGGGFTVHPYPVTYTPYRPGTQ